MKRKMSLVLVLMLIFTTVIPVMVFADDDEMSQLQEQYEKVYRNKGYLYDLPYGLAKRDGDLPYGLAKRNGNLPFGLAKRGVLPVNVIKTLNLDAFVDFVEAVIDAYDDESELIEDLEDLLDEEPLNIATIMAVLDELFGEKEEETFSEWALAQAEKYDADEEQMEELEDMLDEDPIDEEKVEEWLEDLEEAYDLAEEIEEVYEMLDTYGADQDLIDAIENLLDEEPIDWDAIELLLEDLIKDSDIYADALEIYEELVSDIYDMMEDDEFEWPDSDTGESFNDVYDMYKDLVDPTIEELNEANRVLSLMKAYLELDELYSIEEGEVILADLKDDLQDLVDTLEFGTDKGEYDPGLQMMLEELIDQINDLSDPSIFDIIALKGSVEEMLESYEDMRYIETAERHDFIIKRYEVISGYVYEDLNDVEAEELYTLIDEFELPFGSLMSEYLEFLGLYNAFMDAVD